MAPHDFLTMYSIKAQEYFIALSFLLLFVPFWRFLNAAKAEVPARESEESRLSRRVADWFALPEQLHYHPGHAWVRHEGGNLVTVGINDFAQKLMGRVSALNLPRIGTRIGQGEKAWSLTWDSKSVDMLSPVDGTVVAVNERALESPGTLNLDPYGDGWLFKVKAPRLTANAKNLLSGDLARRWMDEVCKELSGGLAPELGMLSQDGGLPVEGIARNLDPSEWDLIARKFFLT